ncbi:hypothetical protein [Natrarchaeobaculum sulfurireducens]|uniref:CHAT domain-containing protein n=1 Tax=Natrarchaeobaculum sulfurireducens TaxID=2044521 RepID=A0A346PTQ5_9EURY|nr:hypothetical protein [Natrarchaeobaculum sulfurireducens]AXR82900.1 hypothetical protein AArcMg_2911 [Natrarchaeobaculum sulfurireducens]
MTITFEETTDDPGLEIHDSIEQRRLHLETARTVRPEVIDPHGFCFPVDRACRFVTDELVLDQTCSVTVHDGTGRTERSLNVGDRIELEDRAQFVGLSGPIKLYCRLDSTGVIDVGQTSIRIALERAVPIELGARSPHDRPAATITTPPDLDSIVEAVSAMPSALKTTSPERTWPTLRGHPPLIELGDDLEIPDPINPPDSDVELVVPPAYEAVFQAAPLAFFLGATVRLGETPRLETPRFERSLVTRGTIEDDVAHLLKRFFFLDCLIRTEGIFQYDLHERSVLEDDLPFDLAEAYAASLPERLERFLEVPYERLEPYLPRWPLTAHVPSEAETVELLPFVVNELGIVRGARGRMTTVSEIDTASAGLVRSTSGTRAPSTFDADSSFVVPDVVDESIEHAWFGDRIPRRASKATVDAYRNQLDRDERSESIDILLVCNDARMLDEHDLLDGAYGNRKALPFEVHSEFGVSTDRLADLLASGDYDFLHYIGHATEDGIRCPDGDLDVRTLESVDLGVFFLNACRSYEQGLALTRRGAFGGVSTYTDVDNEDAVEAGETMARLLNRGFPLRGALEIARQNGKLGDQYLIVGDGSADIAQSDGGAPSIIELDRYDDGSLGFACRSYSTKEYKLGSATASNLASVSDRHLTPGHAPVATVSEDEIQEYLTWTKLPVQVDGTLHWNDGIGYLSSD